MQGGNCWVLRLVLCACLSWPTFSAAQGQPVSQDKSARPLSAKELKKHDKKFTKELSPDDSNWLLNEVPDIITEAERRAFLELGTAEEREQFREIFWHDRNPDPESMVNPVRDEHYRRLAYADEHFASGISGRKTDRGRIYIIWGPPERFKDLEEKVSSRIVHSQIHLEYRADFLRVTTNTVLVPVTVQVPNRDLSFQSKQGLHSAVLDVYGRITTPGGVVVQTFEDVISRDFPDSLFQSSLNLYSIYQKPVPLRSGLYRLDLVVKDTVNGNLGVFNTALRVPHFEDDKLDASSLILADQIETVPSTQTGTGQFVLNSCKVRPRLSREFFSTDKLGIFLQLYNLRLDETSHKTNVSVAYRITKDQQEIWRAVETADHLRQGGEQLTVERLIPIDALLSGRYTIEVTAIDLLTNDTVIRTADFFVKPVAPTNVRR